MQRQAIHALLSGLQADLQDYAALAAMLERQFAAVLSHATPQLVGLGEEITTVCTGLETRRRERVALVDELAPQVPDTAPADRMQQVLARLQEPYRKAARQAWLQLEEQIRQCKRMNERNCAQLLVQHELMMQVLAPQGETYAPR